MKALPAASGRMGNAVLRKRKARSSQFAAASDLIMALCGHHASIYYGEVGGGGGRSATS